MALDTRIQLSKLEIYCRVVELESITRAARELFISQPVVTSHVRTLQNRLGAKLLYRDGHSMLPTEAGQLAYEWAKDVLTRSQEMARRMQGLADGTAGSAAIASSMTVGSYLLPPLLTRFRERRPLAKIGLDVSDPEHVVAGVESGAHDFGVLIADDRALGADLLFDQVGVEELVLVAGRRANVPDEIEPSQLAGQPLVGSPEDKVRERLLSRLLADQSLQRGPTAIELGHAEAMKLAVRESDALSFLFGSSVREELARGELRRVRIAGVDRLTAPIFLAYRGGKDFSAMQSALLSTIRAELGSGSRPSEAAPSP